ncbi:DUF2255 family protein [Streptomyces mayteni]
MAEWTADELGRIGSATELRITSRRGDGTSRPYTTIWGVRVGDDLYVGSAYGPDNGWFRRARTSGRGRVRAGGVERDVSFGEAGPEAQAGIDAAYHDKYDRYGPAIVGSVVGPQAHQVTLRLLPQD